MKIDKFLTKEELPDFFRQLADALENGSAGELACACDFKKLKISVRDEFGQVTLRAKIKNRSECQPDLSEVEGVPTTAAKPKYKELKERMGDSFRVIFKMIHQGKMPPKDAVDSFLADSELMVSYPGFGDPQYAIYTEACQAFAEAYSTGDIQKLNEAVDVLVHQKGHCHAEYK